MSPARQAFIARAVLIVAAGLVVSGCQTTKGKVVSHSRHSSQECLARAMYFESNRSSDDGMLAVGTVVMNRAESGRFSKDVCTVVGQPRQFAPGVLSKPMTEPKSAERAHRVAKQVLKGRRHPKVGKAMFFHTAGYEPGYNNMRYVSIEGGNAFYEKIKKGEDPGRLVQVARKGASSIDDLIAVNQASMLAQMDVPDTARLPPLPDEIESTASLR
ncbi:cell wall hydrolase [Terrihabitans sp. B22-R8]|uniref:cell wall hydrolase n=1 Tax=Terrihabitans sp. B22-R8 TaxID=3425128 RepID=UPI00403C2DC9